jgi:hypothetical protein
VSFSDEERAELIAALSRTADMVAGLLDALAILRVALEAGRQPTDGELTAAPRAFGPVAATIGQAAIAAVWTDDRAANEGAVTPIQIGRRAPSCRQGPQPIAIRTRERLCTLRKGEHRVTLEKRPVFGVGEECHMEEIVGLLG